MLTQYSLLGVGGSGNVYSGEMMTDDTTTKVAIKRPHQNICLIREYENGLHLKKRLLPTTISHHFCLPITMTNDGAIVYPFLDGHTFKHEKNKSNVLLTLMSMSSILRILWEHGITHGDIMKDNIMITTQNSPIFIDLDNMEFERKNSNIALDVHGYSELIRGKLHLFDRNTESHCALHYIVDRLNEMQNKHLQKKYFRFWMLSHLMDEVRSYLEMIEIHSQNTQRIITISLHET